MSTNDVPGAVASNHDELGIGCWAEHSDGSLIFVESTENGRVIYSVFDMSDDDDIVEYRDSMKETAFKKHFTWQADADDEDDDDDDDLAKIKWTWHDKTPFPWDRVIAEGAKDGPRYTHADKQLSAAAKVARSRELHGVPLDAASKSHLVEKTSGKKIAKAIMKGIQKAIDKLDL